MTEITSRAQPSGGADPVLRAYLTGLQEVTGVLEGKATAQVTISAAQVKALKGSPVTLVKAPGPGRVLVFEGLLAFLKFNTAAYGTPGAGQDLAVNYSDASGAQLGRCEAAGFLDGASDQLRFVRPFATTSGNSAIAPAINAPLVMHMLIDEISVGDSPLICRTFYRIVPAALQG